MAAEGGLQRGVVIGIVGHMTAVQFEGPEWRVGPVGAQGQPRVDGVAGLVILAERQQGLSEQEVCQGLPWSDAAGLPKAHRCPAILERGKGGAAKVEEPVILGAGVFFRTGGAWQARLAWWGGRLVLLRRLLRLRCGR